MFRLLITGSREWQDVRVIWDKLNRLDEKLGNRPATLVHGGAWGVDTMAADHWTRALGRGKLKIGDRFAELHEPDWYPHGMYNPRAGFTRNTAMVNSGINLCFAFIHDRSNGATDCARKAVSAGIKTLIWRE